MSQIRHYTNSPADQFKAAMETKPDTVTMGPCHEGCHICIRQGQRGLISIDKAGFGVFAQACQELLAKLEKGELDA